MERFVFLTTIAGRFIDRLAREPELGPKRRSRLSPYEQVAGLLDRLSEGDTPDRLLLSGMTPPAKRLTGTSRRLFVWELRLPNTRVFGWCVEPGVFVGVRCADATRVHTVVPGEAGSHDACARSVARWRKVAKFSHADIWNGADLNAFLEAPGVSPI